MIPTHITLAIAVAFLAPLSDSYGQANPSSPEAIAAAAKSLNDPEFSALRDKVAKQSAAVVGAASGAQANYAKDLVNSPVVTAKAAAMAADNRQIEKQVGPKEIRLAQLYLPGIDQFASDLKNGKYVYASSKGAEIIMLIRSLPMRDEKEQVGILRQLQTLSAQGYPEAQNFIGNIFEFGLFGNQQSIGKAVEFYLAAAKQRYQPALYNLALVSYFGRAGRANVEQAENLLSQAHAIGPESSYRVCGMAAYLEYRQGKQLESVTYARNCKSPLANIPNVVYASNAPMPDKVKMLKDSITAGANDGFRILVQLTKAVPNDAEFLNCKYTLLDRVRFGPVPRNLRDLAKDCYFSQVPGAMLPDGRARSEIAIQGITGFVAAESAAFAQQRKTSKFHHEFSVPFLPYGQADVELFSAIYSKGKP